MLILKILIKLLPLGIFLISCGNAEPKEYDRFAQTKAIQPGIYQFLKSEFFEIKENHYEEITWLLSVKNSIDGFFDFYAKPTQLTQDNISYGAVLVSEKYEYLHIKANLNLSGWIRSEIPGSQELKAFYKSFLREKIERDKARFSSEQNASFYKDKKILSISGYLQISYFKSMKNAFIKYCPILIVENYPYNLNKNSEGYILNLEKMEIRSKSLTGSGFKNISVKDDFIFEIRRDPHYYIAVDEYGKILKEE